MPCKLLSLLHKHLGHFLLNHWKEKQEKFSLLPLILNILSNGFFIRLFQTPLISFTWFGKWPCDDKFIITSVKSEPLHPLCLQVCCVRHFLTRCNPRYVTEKSTTDAKSIALIRFPLNFKLLRNLQMLCCKLWPSAPRFPRNVYHHVITFPESREYLLLLLLLIMWMKPTVLERAKKKWGSIETRYQTLGLCFLS